MNPTTRLPSALATTRLPSKLVRTFDVMAAALISVISHQSRSARQNDSDAANLVESSVGGDRPHLGRRLERGQHAGDFSAESLLHHRSSTWLRH
jgi:hypothetical protein